MSSLASPQTLPDNSESRQLWLRIVRRLKMGLHKQSRRFGLRRDLGEPMALPQAKIPISVRPIEARDIPIVLPLAGMNDAEKLEIADRYSLLERFGMHAHVAVDQRSDTPCYIQWLVGSSHNDAIRQLGGLPALGPDEALLEGAYTPPQHRGLGIMSAAMAMIAERAADLDARYVLTFVGDDNIPSLKGCRRAGFQPHMLHARSQWGFGIHRRDTFQIFDADDARRAMTF